MDQSKPDQAKIETLLANVYLSQIINNILVIPFY